MRHATDQNKPQPRSCLFGGVLAAAVLLAVSVTGRAAPSPILNVGKIEFHEWDFTCEPDIRGGAKSIEESTSFNGKPNGDHTMIVLNDKGKYVSSKARYLSKGDRTFLRAYRYNARGDLAEIVWSKQVQGEEEKTIARQIVTPTAKRDLAPVTIKWFVTSKGGDTMQEAGIVEVTPNLSGIAPKSIVLWKDSAGKEQKRLVITHGKGKDGNPGPAMAVDTMENGTPVHVEFKRDADGNLVGITAKEPTSGADVISTVKYEFDAKNNWTKATMETLVKMPNGKEQKHTMEIIRTISY
jgi:hypothetical protein